MSNEMVGLVSRILSLDRVINGQAETKQDQVFGAHVQQHRPIRNGQLTWLARVLWPLGGHIRMFLECRDKSDGDARQPGSEASLALAIQVG
jgi:hypothetical protein